MTARTIIIGAGPAGLTAAYLLSKAGKPVLVLETDSSHVGGISRTANYKGFLFDIGGHRFFSKSKEVEDLWTELLPNDMLERPRSSRIYYAGKFFTYPLRAKEALLKLGVGESAHCVASYCKARLFPIKSPRNFEDWVTNEFGARLFSIFFRTYTEKVWGMNCKDISADWAAQRIKGLSLAKAIVNALKPAPRTTDTRTEGQIKTLINAFRYPRRGPGMLWEAAADKTRQYGGQILMGHSVKGLAYDSASGLWTVTAFTADGVSHKFSGANVICSAPMREVIPALRPAVSPTAREAAGKLKYRDFLTVALILRDRSVFADNWIYIHDSSVKVGRIQNFKSWSPEMIPDPGLTCYGLEYFCFEGDGLWSTPDEGLVALATNELIKIGLATRTDVLDGCVIRQAKAYPVYDDDYKENVAIIRDELASHFPTLHLVGRNGMHKYNNQDHAMMTSMLCVKNLLAGRAVYDIWAVNEDAHYHEGGDAGVQKELGVRMVPQRIE